MSSNLGIKRSDNLVETIVSKKIFWFLFILFFFSYPIYRSVNRTLPPPLPVIKQLPVYELTNSFGKPFGTKELKGRVYIANFIFTNCPSTCLRLTAEMKKIQKRVRGLGQKVALVSYSVDPVNDTPKVLFKYARSHQASPFVWNFLTGKKDVVRKLLVDDFNVPMGDSEEMEGVVDGKKVTLFDIAHTEKLVLVDDLGNIRGYYDSTKNSINQLMLDVGLLINRKYYSK